VALSEGRRAVGAVGAARHGADTPGLTQHFKKNCPEGFARAMVKTRPGKDGTALSCGYGFVTYTTRAAASKALRQLQGSKLNNHTLTIELSTAVVEPGAEGESKAKGAKRKPGLSSTKMVVRNVPFEATKRDLSQLFTPFGQLKSLRVPRKFDGHHRGFAFIEFVTKKEAENAFEAVKNTHLLGRHLVLEYAKEDGDEDLADLRDKAYSQLQGKGKLARRGGGPDDDDKPAHTEAPKSKKAKFLTDMQLGD